MWRLLTTKKEKKLRSNECSMVIKALFGLLQIASACVSLVLLKHQVRADHDFDTKIQASISLTLWYMLFNVTSQVSILLLAAYFWWLVGLKVKNSLVDEVKNIQHTSLMNDDTDASVQEQSLSFTHL